MNHVEYALKYLHMGWSVIPIVYRSKDKKPLLSWKPYQKRQPTEDEIRMWFGDYFREPTYKEISTWFDAWKKAPTLEQVKEILSKTHNIALCTGKVSNRVVVDCDSPEAIQMYYDLGGDPNGPYVLTARGNQFHCAWKKGADLPYEKWPRGYSGREDLPNIDLRAQGNTAMLPWSVHWNDHHYKWVNTDRINDPPELPEMLLQGDPKKGRSQTGSNGGSGGDKKTWSDLWEGGGEGSRNKTLASLAGSWAAQGLPLTVALENATVWNEKNDPPMEQKDIERTVRSIYAKHQRENPPEEEDEAPPTPFPIELVISAPDLVARNIPPREEIIEGLISAQSLVMLCAKRGLGKTYLALSLAYSIAKGDS